MDYIKSKTCCFTGYRANKFTPPLIPFSAEYYELERKVTESIEITANNGYDTFLCGMCDGFDLMCGNAVIDLRGSYVQYSNLRLVAVMPYPTFGCNFWGEWRKMFDDVFKCADDVILIDETYTRESYYKRNRYLVDNSSSVICYYGGKKGGTAYTVNFGKTQKLNIINLADFRQP